MTDAPTDARADAPARIELIVPSSPAPAPVDGSATQLVPSDALLWLGVAAVVVGLLLAVWGGLAFLRRGRSAGAPVARDQRVAPSERVDDLRDRDARRIARALGLSGREHASIEEVARAVGVPSSAALLLSPEAMRAAEARVKGLIALDAAQRQQTPAQVPQAKPRVAVARRQPQALAPRRGA